jgi:hypothetical protein
MPTFRNTLTMPVSWQIGLAGGAHLAVGQDLGDRVLGRRALLALVGARQVGDVVAGW